VNTAVALFKLICNCWRLAKLRAGQLEGSKMDLILLIGAAEKWTQFSTFYKAYTHEVEAVI
jgi:hypothetical protein